MLAGCCYDQVADAGQAEEGLFTAAHSQAQAADFFHAPGDHGGAGVVSVSESPGNTDSQCLNIFQCAADLHPFFVRIDIGSDTGSVK